MNKREKIIVILAAVIGIYGLMDYFIFSKTPQSTAQEILAQEKLDIDTFAQTASASLTAIRTITQEKDMSYLLARLESEWKKDPFIRLDSDMIAEPEEKQASALPELVYSGFVKIGNKLMAVINGMEYMMGETLRDISFKIKKITPGKVVLMTEANKEIIIFLQEN